MGLLNKAAKRRGELLHKLTKEKKKYVQQLLPANRKALLDGIKKERKLLKGVAPKLSASKLPASKLVATSASGRGGAKSFISATGVSVLGTVATGPITLLKQEGLSAKISRASKIGSGKIDTSKVGSSKVGSISANSISAIKQSIETQLRGSKGKDEVISTIKKDSKRYIFTGLPGFDQLLYKGIPRGASTLVAGGAGSGKTLFALQSLINHAKKGDKCLYMSFEESEEKLIQHMEDFGWPAKKLIKKGNLMVQRFNPFEITRSIDALLLKAKGELMIDLQPIIFPQKFNPDFIVVDSLTAISSAFIGKEDSYRIYIEQLFRFFENLKATSFLITETEQVPKIFSTSGVEEFLADAVVVLYHIKRGNIRERALEILKLRGAAHNHNIVAMNITSDGVEVFPDQEVFGGVDE
jgi:KaiC/GvpD/RAD55 family RecA-like ATPase